jgi:hypothetical protein
MILPSRLPDWRPRLVDYLARVPAEPLAYGSHDCALFVAGAVEAMTGADTAAGYRSTYTSLKAGLKRLQRDGLTDHVALVRSLLEEVPPAFAGVGDLAVIGETGTPALGLFEGESILVLRERGGLGLIPRSAASLAFRVP